MEEVLKNLSRVKQELKTQGKSDKDIEKVLNTLKSEEKACKDRGRIVDVIVKYENGDIKSFDNGILLALNEVPLEVEKEKLTASALVCEIFGYLPPKEAGLALEKVLESLKKDEVEERKRKELLRPDFESLSEEKRREIVLEALPTEVRERVNKEGSIDDLFKEASMELLLDIITHI